MAAVAEAVKCNICNVVRLRRMAWLWHKLARGSGRTPPRDVPPGHLAVTVGNAGRRFVIRASYLNHPVFRQLLDQAYEEYGHDHNGPLAIPCDELLFEEIVRSLRDNQNVSHCRPCHMAEKELGSWRESRPLLHTIARKPTW